MTSLAPDSTPAGNSADALRWAAIAAALAAAGYLVARLVSLGPTPGPWAYWPINGLLCGILYRRPARQWAAIIVAAIAAQVLTIWLVRGDLAGGATPLGAIVGALQAMLGAWILRWRGASDSPLESPHVLAWFVVVGVVLAPLATSPLSALAFSLGLGLPMGLVWGPLFVGNSLSMLLFAPLTMQRWTRDRGERPSLASPAEAIACLALLVLVALFPYVSPPAWVQYVALPYAVFPLLAWAALRCGPRWTAVSIITLATIASWTTARGAGPFAVIGAPIPASVLRLETYLTFVAFTGLLLSALTENRRRSFARAALDQAIRTAFFESSTAIMALRDADGRYIMVNRAAEESFGLPREQLIGRRPAELLDEASARLIAVNDELTIERGAPLVFEETLRDGTRERQFVMTRFPVRDEAGVIRYLGLIGRDETVERELAARLQRAQRVELVGQTAAGLAHDLNNLLHVLVNNTQMLREHEVRTEELEMLQDMSDAGGQAARLTSRLISLGRNIPVERREVVVDDAVRELEPLLRALLRGRIELVLSLEAGAARVFIDPTGVEQVVLNLVANARDALGGTGRVTISTRLAKDAALRLRVEDTGAGMDEATAARVFEPFFTTKDSTRGTGLGLYTVSMLAQQAGGSISVESAPGRGTAFTVLLPIVASS